MAIGGGGAGGGGSAGGAAGSGAGTALAGPNGFASGGALFAPLSKPVYTSPSNVIYCNTGAITTTPGPLAKNSDAPGCQEVVVENDAASSGVLLVGNSQLQKISLAVGQSIVIPIDDPSKIWVVAVSTATVNWLARGKI